jgi:hypothetical protein
VTEPQATPDEPPAAPDDTAPVPDESATVPDEPTPVPTPVPDEPTLARIATPATARRAPRFGAFIGAGALIGFVAGVVLAVVLDTGTAPGLGGVLPFLGGASGARLVTGSALATLGALVGSVIALWADARSRRHAGAR